MANSLSPRLREIVDALPLKSGMRVLEIGCATGATAREVLKRIGNGYILGIDRSAKAIQQAIVSSQEEMRSGRLAFRQIAIEKFELEKGEVPFDLIFAVRVGTLDGRHLPGQFAFPRIAKMLKSEGRFYIDGGSPLREIKLDQYR